MDIEPIAHINYENNLEPLIKHLHRTAELASNMTSEFSCAGWGYLSGLWHDLGKYSDEFQKYIRDNSHIRVDHSTAGAQHANMVLNNKGYNKVMAYAIAGHHGGLPDGNSSADSCLRARLEKKDIPDYKKTCPSLILKPDILNTPLSLPFVPDPEKFGVQGSLFIRMLYSCLVDADFLATEEFMNLQKNKERHQYKSLKELEPIFFKELEKKRNFKNSSINAKRNDILEQCLSASRKAMGIFSLTVPTGGGKTLSSMAFAIRHAIEHNLNRIIYVIPFTSIIEQNAEVFRSMVGGDSVIEHHSNFESDDENDRSRLAAENWDAPIIVTTNVQFFESLFANRSSRCRKLHNISNSIIILDEVQTLPAPFLLPCLEALKELAATYKVSIVLCSATQPAIKYRLDFPKGLDSVVEIIKNPKQLAQDLKRTDVHILGKITNNDLMSRLISHKQVLCIVNTRKHAKILYEIVEPKDNLIHLSALMCPVHRSHKLAEIKSHLRYDRPCRVISTQLVEAGVDIDFPFVYRSLAGIDSIAQAAGRCNREGKVKSGQVFVFTPEEGIPAGHFRQTAETAESVIRKYPKDILSLEAIEDYFRNYYWVKGDKLDEGKILEKLHAGLRETDFPFKTIAELFRFIKNDLKPVIIPFDDNARSLIRSIDYVPNPMSLARKLQKYTVTIYPNEWQKLFSQRSIEIKMDLFSILTDSTLYDNNLGLRTLDSSERDPESFYV